MIGYQASGRGGEVTVELAGDRALLCGNAVTVVWGVAVFRPATFEAMLESFESLVDLVCSDCQSRQTLDRAGRLKWLQRLGHLRKVTDLSLRSSMSYFEPSFHNLLAANAPPNIWSSSLVRPRSKKKKTGVAVDCAKAVENRFQWSDLRRCRMLNFAFNASKPRFAHRLVRAYRTSHAHAVGAGFIGKPPPLLYRNIGWFVAIVPFAL